MAYWLLKSEPSAYCVDDLARDKKTWWDGVRNYQARNFMRDDMVIGDGVLFYHSSCKVPAVVGIATISQTAHPDHTQFDSTSDYFDARATDQKPYWWYVQVRFERYLLPVLTLSTIRQNPKLADMSILKKGNRLSITPVTQQQWNIITKAR